MEAFIQANGGDVVKTVTNKCTHLMSSESGTKKCADAEKKGVVIVDEAWVREQCGGSGMEIEEEEDDDDDEKEDEKEDAMEEEEEAISDNIYVYFRGHPLSQYVSNPTDCSCLFQSQRDGTMKFWKYSTTAKVGGEVFTVYTSGTVGTEEGVSETTVKYASHGEAIRASSKLRTEKFMLEDEEEYKTFQDMYNELKELQLKKAKKAKMSTSPPPSLTGKSIHDGHKLKPMWVSFLQKFLASYDYLGDSYFLDYSDKDMSKWKWYEAYDDEDCPIQKKRHTALIKKDKFAKQMSKENRNKFFHDDSVAAFDYGIFELSIDGNKFYLLSFSMCVNDPMGHYNVLYDNSKKEIFRIEVLDSDAELDGDGKWSSAAMKTKYKSLVQSIEPFILSSQILGVQSSFTFDCGAGGENAMAFLVLAF